MFSTEARSSLQPEAAARCSSKASLSRLRSGAVDGLRCDEQSTAAPYQGRLCQGVQEQPGKKCDVSKVLPVSMGALRRADYLSASCVSASCLLSRFTHLWCFLASPAASAAALSLACARALEASCFLTSSRCLAWLALRRPARVRQEFSATQLCHSTALQLNAAPHACRQLLRRVVCSF